MQLKKLEIQGFKSFANKTEIEFLNGVTTIVGPNGSGKSNISDAVRWVLGEQSIKNLRGSKMEDVIFAGTQNRSKVGFAYVSMYLDNSDKSLPIEYDEVVVTRKIYRTGETGYYINGTECRLRDIQELFMDTGIGKDGYSIISQGKIDEILSNKSEERRAIFEEASGIVKYRVRKEEASKKLANTNINLSRLNDVLNEIQNNIDELQKKSETAKKYLNLKEQLKYAEVKLFLKNVQKNLDGINQIDQNINIFQNDKQLQEQENIKVEQEKTDVKSQLEEILNNIDLTQKKYYENETKFEKINANLNLINEKNLNLKQDIERLNNEIFSSKQNISDLKNDITKRLEKKQQLFKDQEKFKNELDEKQQEYQKIREGMDQKDIEIEEIKSQIEEISSKKYELNELNSSLKATLNANQKQLDYILKNENKDLNQNDDIKKIEAEISEKIKQINEEINNIKISIQETNSLKFDISSNMSEISKKRNEMQQNLMSITSKYNYLKNLELENEGYYKSVKSVLDYARQIQLDNVFGTVASIISTDAKYEYAIEIALGGFLQNVVVKSDNEAKKMISYLRQNAIGRVTFLPLESIKTYKQDIDSKLRAMPGFVGMASDLVEYDKMYQKVIDLTLNRTVVVDNIDSATYMSKKINGFKFVTLSGELISSSGSITGGQSKLRSTGLIGRQEKIQNLKKQQLEYEEKLKQITLKQEEDSKKLEDIQKQLFSKNELLNNLNIESATLNEKYTNILKEIQKQENAKKSTLELKERLENENQDITQKIQLNTEKISDYERQIIEKKSIVEEYARFNKEKEQKISFLNEDITNLKISISSFDESVASIDEMKQKIQEDIQNFQNTIENKHKQIDENTKKIQENILNIEKLNNDITNLNEFKSEFNNIIENLKSKKQECSKRQEILDLKTVQNIAKLDNIKDEINKLESKKIKYNLEIENSKNNIWDDYELTISSAKKYIESAVFEYDEQENLDNNSEKSKIKDINYEKLSDDIQEKIRELGNVDVGAIDEYKKTKERLDFMTNQKKDLDDTKEKLENLIENMTTIMRQQFASQFKLIANNFDNTFKELFGGGRAKLTLSDQNNVLESGIEIEVEPPGKKLQSMMLLSGGERALTAIALLFAILKIKAPPFCILDEIEAALDDVNVQRFAEYIKKYSDNTQFIVITHRKGTMEVASSVYGVTMQEYGISKVISMKMV